MRSTSTDLKMEMELSITLVIGLGEFWVIYLGEEVRKEPFMRSPFQQVEGDSISALDNTTV